MTDSSVTMSVTPGAGKMISRTDSSLSKQAATSQTSGKQLIKRFPKLSSSQKLKIKIDLAFNNVKPKNWYFVLDL